MCIINKKRLKPDGKFAAVIIGRTSTCVLDVADAVFYRFQAFDAVTVINFQIVIDFIILGERT